MQHPCGNSRCPNEWHRTPTCPRLRSGGGHQGSVPAAPPSPSGTSQPFDPDQAFSADGDDVPLDAAARYMEGRLRERYPDLLVSENDGAASLETSGLVVTFESSGNTIYTHAEHEGGSYEGDERQVANGREVLGLINDQMHLAISAHQRAMRGGSQGRAV